MHVKDLDPGTLHMNLETSKDSVPLHFLSLILQFQIFYHIFQFYTQVMNQQYHLCRYWYIVLLKVSTISFNELCFSDDIFEKLFNVGLVICLNIFIVGPF